MFEMGYNLGAPRESAQMVSRVAVIMLNVYSVRFSDNMTLRRQHFGKGIPVIRVKYTVGEVFYFVVETSECCSITTAEHPGHGSPCITVNGFDEPKLVFFEPIKCHISSNSMCRMSPGTSGSGKLSPNALIQR